jgi:hypothetical protein
MAPNIRPSAWRLSVIRGPLLLSCCISNAQQSTRVQQPRGIQMSPALSLATREHRQFRVKPSPGARLPHTPTPAASPNRLRREVPARFFHCGQPDLGGWFGISASASPHQSVTYSFSCCLLMANNFTIVFPSEKRRFGCGGSGIKSSATIGTFTGDDKKTVKVITEVGKRWNLAPGLLYWRDSNGSADKEIPSTTGVQFTDCTAKK